MTAKQRDMTSEVNWRRDSDMVFTAVSTSGARSIEEAKRMVVLFYAPDMSISRAGISHALGRLEKHWKGVKPT